MSIDTLISWADFAANRLEREYLIQVSATHHPTTDGCFTVINFHMNPKDDSQSDFAITFRNDEDDMRIGQPDDMFNYVVKHCPLFGY